MKIKKVEISAFRAFDKLEDSTFDFSLTNKDIANFVSIYAPNGYGKTSFYDAVEWGVTGQISRFQRNFKENKKLSIDNRSLNEKIDFIQHNGQKILGFVNLYTDDKFYKRKIKKTVYNFQKAPENIFFNDVILSQDLIDSFIKEDTAHERYDKFIRTIPLIEELNTALQNIIRLTKNILDKRTASVKDKEKIEELISKIKTEGFEKVLDEINNSISFLIENKEEIKLINNEFSESENIIITNKIKSAFINLNEKIGNLKIFNEKIDKAYKGDKDILGIVQYYVVLKNIDKINKSINDFEKHLKALNQKNINTKNKETLNIDLESNIIKLKNALNIKEKFNQFETSYKNIVKFKKDFEENLIKLEKVKKIGLELTKEANNLEIDLSKEKKKYILLEEKKKNIPLFENQIKSTNVLLKESKKIEKSIETKNKVLSFQTENLEKYNLYLKRISNDIESILNENIFNDYKLKLNEIIELNKKINTLKKELIELNQKIDRQTSLDTELKDFISKGLKIISTNQDTSCPLCLTDFDSYTELSNRISNNPLIDELLKDSLEKKTNLELKINTKKSRQYSIINEIKTFSQNVINKEIKNKNQSKNDLENLKIQLKNLKESIRLEKESITNFFEIDSLDNINIDEYLTKNNKAIFDNDKIIKELKENIRKSELDIDTNSKSIEKIIKNNQSITDNIEKEKNQAIYKHINKYFLETIKSNRIDKNSLDTFISTIESNIKNLKEKIKTNGLELLEISKALTNNIFNIDDLKKQLKSLNDKKELHNKEIKNYQNFINNKFNLEILKLKQGEVEEKFTQLNNNNSKEIQSYNDILKHYKIVDELKENVYNYLETEKNKKRLEEKENEITLYNKIESDLNIEKDNIETHLKKTIDNFFYTKLINKIYSKIDPHPESDKIEFNCDFSEDKPRLQIYTTDSNNQKLTPALYFSSAQINILSLSIFLARALKATNPSTNEPIRCIFIDDPIQSMDSINILSFIDLFRSITINLDRQLIVATHEENFHLLLQKKIPTNLFKSKYIQFETFGKLEKKANA